MSCQGRKNRDSQLNQHLSDVYRSAVNFSRGLQPWRTQDHTLGQVRKIWAVCLLHLTPWHVPSKTPWFKKMYIVQMYNVQWIGKITWESGKTDSCKRFSLKDLVTPSLFLHCLVIAQIKIIYFFILTTSLWQENNRQESWREKVIYYLLPLEQLLGIY